MNGVSVGQTWSVLANNSLDRYEFAVDRIDRDERPAYAIGHTATGKSVRVPLATLQKGQRGARIVRDATGTPVLAAPAKVPLGLTMGTRLEGATARATIKPPRGLTPAERAEWLLKNERRTA